MYHLSSKISLKSYLRRLDRIYVCIRRHKTTEDASIQKTSLYNYHIKKQGKMVPFAGYYLPVKYANQSISASHEHTRNHVSLFDVSHMLQTQITGRDRKSFMESLTVGNIEGLKPNQGTLTVLTNNKGGIIDDLIVTNATNEYLYIVSNAGCRDKDLANFQAQEKSFQSQGKDVQVKVLSEHSLVAVQGPGSSRVLQPLVKVNLAELYFMHSIEASIIGIPNCRITRCGYTGEDGFELSVPNDEVEKIVECLLNSKEDKVELAGLGARDSLRLEAGLCLYGNDINENTTPVEASLIWLIGKNRRTTGNFPGSEIILKQLKEKPSTKRVGFLSKGPPARIHTPILDNQGKQIGEVTSGCPSPTLKQNVAMGYVTTDHSKVGTKVQFDVRKKLVEAVVSKMPFVPHRYYIQGK